MLKSDHKNSWYIWAKFALISPLHAGIFKSTPKWFWEPQFHFSLNVILPKIWENRVDLTNFRQNMSKLVREKWNCGSQSHLGVDLKIPACRGDIKANLAQIYQEYSWLDFSTKHVETKSSFQPTVSWCHYHHLHYCCSFGSVDAAAAAASWWNLRSKEEKSFNEPTISAQIANNQQR